MSIAEPVKRDATAEIICASAVRWLITPELALRVYIVAAILDVIEIMIISGWRTASEQEVFIRDGTGAADALSTHRDCPFATGVDINVVGYSKADTPAKIQKAVGDAAKKAGLRWGGGSRANPKTGYPIDWNHLDLGPRKQASLTGYKGS